MHVPQTVSGEITVVGDVVAKGYSYDLKSAAIYDWFALIYDKFW